MDDLRKHVAMLIKTARNNRGMTQEDLADRAGLSVQSISALENAKNYPGLDTLINLSEILSFDIADVVLDRNISEKRFSLMSKGKSLLNRLDDDLLAVAVKQAEALVEHADQTRRAASRTRASAKK